MKPKFIRIIKTTDPLNWWNHKDIIGKTFEVLEVSKYNYAKIEYWSGYYGWLPLEMCEINPHLKLVQL
ncbi:hypothetical protein JK635_02475 [Neobacillus sp. YIM B02564]|uniref:SH3 domain-containing protein n=1 Tax=Neobacillus paridis TaxID=2803862 RepID=A0ABS1TIG2_9BACI|nr:hypothetical protein [Neobacillus paridis]MBL4951106.1 hypothetical protein [Neobacillus paridis]